MNFCFFSSLVSIFAMIFWLFRFLVSLFFTRGDDDIESNRSQPNRNATQNRPEKRIEDPNRHYYSHHYDPETLRAKLLASHVQKTHSSATSASHVKSKGVSSPSPQKPVVVSSVKSVAKPNTSTSYLYTNSLPYQDYFSSPRPGASTNPFTIKVVPDSSDVKDPCKIGKGGTQRYAIPKHIEEMIKRDIVPPALQMPLSPDTYSDYFAALLYAEDFYCEKWSDYLLENVTLKLRIKENTRLQNQSQSNDKKSKRDSNSTRQKKNHSYVVFEIKDVHERRPYLLSRDHVHLKPLDNEYGEPFHGILFRVEKSRTILAEFDDNFHRQHNPSKRYDVSFSFNRVCLKRAHRAVSAATNPLIRQILFPKLTFLPVQRSQVSLKDRILNYRSAPIPYLVEGPSDWMITHIEDIVLNIYKSSKESRVLICASKNSICDDIMSAIMKKVNKCDLFRANAAFRDKEVVPGDVMPACLFHGECFTCPPLHELQNFRIITSTFISTFRLYNAGLKAGHFSHIFLVDASSAIEPEVIVALADLVSEETVVVITGCAGQEPLWVRSDIGRRQGLKKSFFERLLEREPYKSGSPHFITCVK